MKGLHSHVDSPLRWRWLWVISMIHRHLPLFVPCGEEKAHCSSLSHCPWCGDKCSKVVIEWSCLFQEAGVPIVQAACYKVWPGVFFNLSFIPSFLEVLEVFCWLRWAGCLFFCVHLGTVTDWPSLATPALGFGPWVCVIFTEVRD